MLLKKYQIPRRQSSYCKKSDRQRPIDVGSMTLPRSPASLSSGNEVPHIFTRKSRVRPKEILITSAKRLFQQHRPTRDMRGSGSLDRKMSIGSCFAGRRHDSRPKTLHGERGYVRGESA